MSMPLPDLETVRAALASLESILTNAYLQAWRDWQAAGLTHWRKRGRANYVWEQATHHALLNVSQRPDVTVIVKNESYHFLVDEAVSFRMKKADNSGFTSNYPTQEALAFHDSQQPLTGIPAAQRVEVTYTLNKAETDISDIVVVAREGDNISWSYSLMGIDAVAALPGGTGKSTSAEDMGSTGLVRSKSHKNKQNHAGDAGEQ